MKNNKIQNLERLVEDINRKIENLELQRRIYTNKISILKEKQSQLEKDDESEE